MNCGLIMGFDKLLNAFFYSLSGIKFLLQERAFLQEIMLGVILFVLMFFSQNTKAEILYIFSSYCLVLITESLNTCIETVVNRISLKKDPLSKKAKDIGSAAVFFALVHLGMVLVSLIRI
ncbi:MAG: diacylglycerol kinase [Alphaproteobacteria bacterium]|nr:diacylglycerol kinase [Alphaproteobacteria bacterium]